MPTCNDDVFSVEIVMVNKTTTKIYQEFRQENLAKIEANIVCTAISQALTRLGIAQAKEMGTDPAKIAVLESLIGGSCK